MEAIRGTKGHATLIGRKDPRHSKSKQAPSGSPPSGLRSSTNEGKILLLQRSKSMRKYLSSITYRWIDEDCETAYLETLVDSRSFQKFWKTHPEWQQNVGDAIYECLVALEQTGLLKDSPECLTVAVVEDACLDFNDR
ncbi:hypothetical protein K458DRAFT_382166 [Lentithecium fluviatile CBS 122367]|uniref:Uncharacterized protein n=1 Tax=Lentithecium fluviatile CBS 122367 TaxID=1168545 RepID=A0A6G1JJ74_9PLEO|nr:hypothetical protein K458DRAFT_382166 [Lentithecium fluviatile CBS 122367]